MDPYFMQCVILYDTEFLCLELNINIKIKYMYKISRITGFFLLTFPSSGILETRKHDILETGTGPSSGKGGGEEDTYSVGPLRKELISITG
jgi:hypothetical protein